MEADYLALKAETATFKLSAFSENTKRSYKSQLYSYIRFCLHYGLVAVPASPSTICDYSSFLARSLKSSSIPCYLNVIRILHVDAGYENPLERNWQLTMVKRGISRKLGLAFRHLQSSGYCFACRFGFLVSLSLGLLWFVEEINTPASFRFTVRQ